MKALLFLCTILLNISLLAQTAAPQDSPAPAQATEDYSGTYSFLQEGEFVQINVEGQGKITGFVSRFGDTETDRGLFLDHFFKEGKLDGKNLTFSTKTVHSVWY